MTKPLPDPEEPPGLLERLETNLAMLVFLVLEHGKVPLVILSLVIIIAVCGGCGLWK